MSTREKAIEISARAHAGQVDKAGAPDLLHPLRVMLSVKMPQQQMAAVLHDVVEDTPVTLEDLKARRAFLKRCWRRSRPSPRSRVRPVWKPLAGLRRIPSPVWSSSRMSWTTSISGAFRIYPSRTTRGSRHMPR